MNSTISTNVADHGGGIYVRTSLNPTILNSTISTNVADDGNGGGNGGGLNANDDNLIGIFTSTINGNTAVGQGGGIFTEYYPASVYTVFSVIVNTVVANSVGGDIGGMCPGVPAAYNWVETFSCAIGARSGDPMLGPLQDNGGPTLTHAPLPGSGLIDGSLNCLNPATALDQRGEPRVTATVPGEGPCFIGAVEGIQESEDNFFVIPLGNGRSVVAPL